ncbi:hypothetical protein F5B22DRAFT_656656 [Xylaria bambusicola]|uniref:uncharacterized protein n=1 Tax=Xylaria bambusicola TaxID=326684 RepID=UPI0020083CFB|nr:uncharacterized protein F5B22DRAFT_656656 [Xylaria bambusicola]KAI0514698.1 hypothetical protein F5B22DRAFT_656656 [Xylaria bambusicola]
MLSSLLYLINDIALGPGKRKVKQYLDAATRGVFYFYARHPFPTALQETQGAKLDFESFKRAALLTVFQADSLLGTRELDWYWREDAAFFQRAGISRVFSSIALPSVSCGSQQNIDVGAFNDAMDVLVMTGPQLINAVPSEDQLESGVRRLFAEGGRRVMRGQMVRRKDLSTVIDPMLRLRLREQTWGLYHPLGDIIEENCECPGETKALVDFLAGNNSREDVGVQQLSRVADLLPNFLLRFQQLWTVLLQPAESADITKLPVRGIELPHITGIISFFAPHIDLDNVGRQRSNVQNTQITLNPLTSGTSGSLDATILHQSQALSNSVSAHVVLFTTAVDVGVGTLKTIIGGYFPTEGAHVLFQLQPSFRLLHSTKRNVSLADLVKTESKLSDQTVGSEESSSLYWIGDPIAPGAGIRVDPKQRTARLARETGDCYTDVQVSSGEDSGGMSGDLTIHDARMDLFVVAGTGIDKKS